MVPGTFSREKDSLRLGSIYNSNRMECGDRIWISWWSHTLLLSAVNWIYTGPVCVNCQNQRRNIADVRFEWQNIGGKRRDWMVTGRFEIFNTHGQEWKNKGVTEPR